MKRKIELILLATCLLGGRASADVTPNVVSPWDRSDGEWLTISGKVIEAGADTFRLDYGKGDVVVEMDDYDRELEGFHIKKDDQVVVTGRVDADAGERRTIEAGSVYVENIRKSFFASAADEEDALGKLRKATREGQGTLVSGTIALTAGSSFTLDTGYQVFEVITGALGEPAFDKTGDLQLERGDRVTVYGSMDDGFSSKGVLLAAQIQEWPKE